jgi:hypothetical protein
MASAAYQPAKRLAALNLLAASASGVSIVMAKANINK